VVIIIASTLLRRRVGVTVASVAWLLYGATVVGLNLGWLTPPGPLEAVATSRLVYSLVIHLFGFYAVAFLTSHLAQDVSRAERALHAKREDLANLQEVHRDVIESIPSGLVTCGLDGLVTSVNAAGEQILGLSQADLAGQPVSEVGLFNAAKWKVLRERAPGDPPTRWEARYRRGGSDLYIGYSVNPLTNGQQQRTGNILIFQDLSDWRKLQEEMRLKERLAAVGELASGIAHEVGNPLAAISGSVQMLSGSLEGTDSQRKLLDIILNESQRLDRTIKSFLQFARPKERSNVRFDIAQLLGENLDLLRNSSEVSEHHKLELELDPPSVALIADPDQISQIFWNLARNALRAMPDGGTLRVEGVLRGGTYYLRVIDDGRGMSRGEQDKMFHPFHSFFDGGSGIGMAIVYRIVEEHGGRVSVDSRPTDGTTLSVELPVVSSPVATLPAEV
jgi:two-component system sensor histidine kinase PilS (NtrC family)